jgi:eukaryotic-like serine/threonine-protein kinase
MEADFPSSYEPVRELGQGGMGTVWEAVEPGSGLSVVIKMPTGDLDAEDLARFKREIRLQSQLDHENILPILDFDLDSARPWFAAPKAEGNLAEVLPKSSEQQAMQLFADVVHGIAFAHRNRVLHRDIKPQNVLVFFSDRGERPGAKVADFGLGRQFTRDTPFQTATGMMAGTPGFAAPEQWIDLRSVDHRADIFGLGRLLKYTLNVTVPEDSMLARRLEYCIRTSTAALPDDRYHSAEELAADLRLALERPSSLQRPVDTALSLIQTLMQGSDFGAAATRPLAVFLLENRDDYRLMMGMLPRIPTRLWSALMRDHVAAMLPVLEGYVAVLEDPLAVDSAMAAMRVLEDIVGISHDDRVHELCLKAVLCLAERYDVGEVAYIAARCIAAEESEFVIQALARFLKDNPQIAAWCAARLQKASLAPVLRNAIKDF